MFIVFISLILQLTLRPCARKVALKPFTWHCMAAGAPSKQLWVPCWKGVYTYIYIQKKYTNEWKFIYTKLILCWKVFSPELPRAWRRNSGLCLGVIEISREGGWSSKKRALSAQWSSSFVCNKALSPIPLLFPKFSSNSMHELVCSSFRKKKWSCRLLMNVHHDQQSPVKFWGRESHLLLGCPLKLVNG